MFDSVLGRTLGAPGRPGLGLAVSVALHLLFLAVALQLAQPPPLALAPRIRVVFPRGLPGTLGSPPKALTSTAPGRRTAALRPRTSPPLPSAAMDTQASSPTVPDLPGDGTHDGPTGAPPNSGQSSCIGPACGDGQNPNPGALTSQMQPPQLLSGPEPVYPTAAALEHVGGSLLVRCTVTEAGRVADCVVLKSLPFMEEPVLEALYARRYRPALRDGKPTAVKMVFPVRVIPP